MRGWEAGGGRRRRKADTELKTITPHLNQVKIYVYIHTYMKEPIRKANHDIMTSGHPSVHQLNVWHHAQPTWSAPAACGSKLDFKPLDELVPDDTPTFACMRIKRT